MNGSKFPRENRSRRPGWTQGPGLVLANGETWYLPTLDERLIPFLPKLVPSAKYLVEYLGIMDGDDCIFDPAREMADSYSRILMLDLLNIQYRNRDCTLRALTNTGDDDVMGAVFGDYLNAFNHFVCNRYPVGFDVASLLATMN